MDYQATLFGDDEVGATSLDTTSETVEGLLKCCPRRPPRWLVDSSDPSRWLQTGCDAYTCDYCGPQKARQFARASSWVLTQKKHPRFATFTNAPEDWQKRRQRVRDLARTIRAAGYSTEWAWTTEEGKDTGMVHVHAVQWGSFIPQDELQDMWGSIVDIRAVKVTTKAVGDYMVKSAEGVGRYMTKAGVESYQRWYDLNGGRPMHSSRGFFMGMGVRGALTAANASSRKGPATKWEVPSAAQLESYMAFRATGDVSWLPN